MLPEDLSRILSLESSRTFQRAWQYSESLIRSTESCANAIFREYGVDSRFACISVVGSVGRREALEASDIDMLPIWGGPPSGFKPFKDAMEILRERIRQELSIEVSSSRDLMRCTQLSKLSNAITIGGDKDNRRSLTQRILILTEGSHAGGGLSLIDVRRRILEAYVGNQNTQRTASRHPLAVCNDIARYFRTVCVDYKSRAEAKPENWCVRHSKLRGARKFWYFSTAISIASIVAQVPVKDNETVVNRLIEILNIPPILRVFCAATGTDSKAVVGRLLGEFSTYLREMSNASVRSGLNLVEFEHRFSEELPNGGANPFPRIFNTTKRMHREMMLFIDTVDNNVREKLLDWFLL